MSSKVPVAYAVVDAGTTVPLASLSALQVYQLLSALKCSAYKWLFLRQEIDGHALAHCRCVEDLQEIGIDIAIKARSLYHAIEQCRQHALIYDNGVPTHIFDDEPRPRRAFRFQSVKYPSMCLQLDHDDGRDGDKCVIRQTSKSKRNPAQAWVLDGHFIRSAVDSTKGINLCEHGPTFNGDVCLLWELMHHSWLNQEWDYDGTLIRSMKDPTKCIHVKSGDETICHLWDIIVDQPCPAQEWRLVFDMYLEDEDELW
ncbi:hypothetical protein SDRG_02261 [Saprolegnia diclina VS20]|uniref:SAM domain-containing protein n=1 Tax=Saprolegnia diclina (strain VS20) TaxID=1156394 RepID=T0R1Z8_SAPDV|nr:hypothetical protein SDRG_02261 [Saprolegnia diclina VS20]EQC40360.1 hypothetical protein SDRG_02261 [Saprolegnia diclina VS20]|eukprot:XP_008606059.1 hypothetical protein SDRG_02261 [Saprolegnia diclina VS20]